MRQVRLAPPDHIERGANNFEGESSTRVRIKCAGNVHRTGYKKLSSIGGSFCGRKSERAMGKQCRLLWRFIQINIDFSDEQ